MQTLDLVTGFLMGAAIALPFGLVNTLLLKNLGSRLDGTNRRYFMFVNIIKVSSYFLVVFALSRVEYAMAAGALLPFLIQVGITSWQVIRKITGKA